MVQALLESLKVLELERLCKLQHYSQIGKKQDLIDRLAGNLCHKELHDLLVDNVALDKMPKAESPDVYEDDQGEAEAAPSTPSHVRSGPPDNLWTPPKGNQQRSHSGEASSNSESPQEAAQLQPVIAECKGAAKSVQAPPLKHPHVEVQNAADPGSCVWKACLILQDPCDAMRVGNYVLTAVSEDDGCTIFSLQIGPSTRCTLGAQPSADLACRIVEHGFDYVLKFRHADDIGAFERDFRVRMRVMSLAQKVAKLQHEVKPKAPPARSHWLYAFLLMGAPLLVALHYAMLYR